MLSVVHFTSTDDVDIVPTSWMGTGMVEGKCQWPSWKNAAKIGQAVKEKQLQRVLGLSMMLEFYLLLVRFAQPILY